MPDIIPYTAGTDLASAAGYATGRARSLPPIQSFMAGFAPGLKRMNERTDADNDREKKIGENRKLLDGLESDHPELSKDPAWFYVHGVGDSGGDLSKAMKDFVAIREHRATAEQANRIKEQMAGTAGDRVNATTRGQDLSHADREAAEQGRNNRANQSQGGMMDRLVQGGKQAMERVLAVPHGKQPPTEEDTQFAQSKQHLSDLNRYASQMRQIWDATNRDLMATPEEKTEAHNSYMDAMAAANEAADTHMGSIRKRDDARRKGGAKPAAPADGFQATFDAMPSGTVFTGPDGKKRRKP